MELAENTLTRAAGIEQVSVRAKRAPNQIATDREAYDALRCMIRYQDMAAYALAQAHRYTGGTETSRKHHRRHEEYAEIADQWHRVLNGYLAMKAGVTKWDN
jgi:hypothetical protein